MSEISDRKKAHIDLCLNPESQGSGGLFADWQLPYRALPEINLSDMTTKTTLFGHSLNQPLIIASMTGGTAHAQTINTNLAIAAEACGVAMGVGSQRIALELDDAKASFALTRTHAPKAFLFANMGAIQLNHGCGIDDYQRIIDMIQANALYLHLNPLQEALQPSGDTNYAGLIEKIADLVSRVDVPVLVKEVGHGLDVASARMLLEAGVAGIDTAGVSGTSWAWVEAKRAGNAQFERWFKDFGYRTDVLVERYQNLKADVKVVSGGLRSPVEALKARGLGMTHYSLAQPLLQPALNSPEAVMTYVHDFEEGLKIAMFACGVTNWDEVKDIQLERLT